MNFHLKKGLTLHSAFTYCKQTNTNNRLSSISIARKKGAAVFFSRGEWPICERGKLMAAEWNLTFRKAENSLAA